MFGRAKKFVRRIFDRPMFPAAMEFYYRRDLRKLQEWQERRAQMTYQEIEAEINIRYEKTFGRKMNWDNPQTYNEKIHVSKVYMPTPEKTRLADKYLVREWIAEKIGSEYLIPLFGFYENFDEIDFDELPNEFVIKCNHDCASVTLVNDKSKIDKKTLKKKYDLFMSRNYAWGGFEMHYKDIKPKIIIEKFMGDAISDYKFTCFNGKPCCCRIDFERFGNHRRNVYNMDWEILPFMKGEYKHPEKIYSCPDKYSTMKNIIHELAKGFEQVRIDLYLIDGKIYFGEMTFTNANGFEKFFPDEWDYKFGALWPFDNSVRKKVLAEHSRP